MSIYTLEPVAKASPYTNAHGEGLISIKVRAITRDGDGRISSKRGVVLSTNDVREAPHFVLNVYKEWDGLGELQYCIYDASAPTFTDFHIPDWTTV